MVSIVPEGPLSSKSSSLFEKVLSDFPALLNTNRVYIIQPLLSTGQTSQAGLKTIFQENFFMALNYNVVLLDSTQFCCEMLPVGTSWGSIGETQYCDSNQSFTLKTIF